jgi:dipeptidyl aminopeptidase/acylaminoacyl peptidase
VADFYGPVDFPHIMRSASAPILVGLMGQPYEGHEAEYKDASPIFHVDAASRRVGKAARGRFYDVDAASSRVRLRARQAPPPFLIFHGTLDVGNQRGQVPIGMSVALHRKLRRAGGQATLVKVPGAVHGFSSTLDGPQCAKAWKRTLRFFAKHLM